MLAPASEPTSHQAASPSRITVWTTEPAQRNDMPPSADQGPPEAEHPHPPPPAYSAASPPTAAPSTAAKDPDTAFRPLPLLSPNNDHDRMLPPLSSVTGGHTLPIRSDMAHVVGQQPPPQWPALTPLTPHQGLVAPPMPAQQKPDSPGTMDIDTSSNSVTSAASPDPRNQDRAGSVNLDDPDVRLAAEALGDLRAGEYPADHGYIYHAPP